MQSSSIPDAGLGVFALKPVARNTIVGYFNGVHRHRKDVFSSGDDSVYLVEGGHPNEMLDIPPEFTDWQNYQASTGIPTELLVEGDYDVRLSWIKKTPLVQRFPIRPQEIFTPCHLINPDDFSQGHLINHKIFLQVIWSTTTTREMLTTRTAGTPGQQDLAKDCYRYNKDINQTNSLHKNQLESCWTKPDASVFLRPYFSFWYGSCPNRFHC